MTAEAVERLALFLRGAHPDVQPLEAPPGAVTEWIDDAGGDGGDDDLVAAVLVAWEGLL